MKVTVFTIIIVALSNFSLVAQETSPSPTAAKALPPDLPVTSTVMRTNSMSVLDDKKRLGSNDYVSFRVVEDRDAESQHLRVNDNDELEVPYIWLCRQRDGPAASWPTPSKRRSRRSIIITPPSSSRSSE